MIKQVSCDAVARQAMLRGVNKLAGAVQVTLGPKGRYVTPPRRRPKEASSLAAALPCCARE